MNCSRLYKAKVNEKDGITEKLVCEKVSKYGIEYKDIERDTINNRLFYAYNININIDKIVQLVPLNRILDLKDRVSVRTILKLYYED